jgi:hypothetical protein
MGLKLIGIAGKARSGKDTLANILMNEHGFIKLSMALPLKAASAPLFAWPEGRVHEDDFKLFDDPFWGFTVREGYQRLGDAMKREFGEDFWARTWLCTYSQIKDKFSVVVPDIRFEEEAAMIRSLGGVIVHISRDGAGLQGTLANHRSEKGVEIGEKDVRIENNSTLTDLEESTFNLIQFIEHYSEPFGLKNLITE